jgi:hypothetical protein
MSFAEGCNDFTVSNIGCSVESIPIGQKRTEKAKKELNENECNFVNSQQTPHIVGSAPETRRNSTTRK